MEDRWDPQKIWEEQHLVNLARDLSRNYRIDMEWRDVAKSSKRQQAYALLLTTKVPSQHVAGIRNQGIDQGNSEIA